MSDSFAIRAEDLELSNDRAAWAAWIEQRDQAAIDAMDRALWLELLFGPTKPQVIAR